ncbi:MAG: site-2 protease family protein [Pyrinomonadaceae bacterium]
MSSPEIVFSPSRMRGMRPKTKTWIKHLAILVLTFFTCTLAGAIRPFGYISPFEFINAPPDADFTTVMAALPLAYVLLIKNVTIALFTNAIIAQHAVTFSVSFLLILTAHEMGHYIACRIYGVNATLPFFIPTPPMIGPAGTLGAFIRIISPFPSRQALFDIGVAGPIAGFVVVVPIAVLSFLTYKYAPNIPMQQGDFDITFSDPLFNHILAPVFGIDLSVPAYPNPFYSAAWLGFLVTALNLIPSGQLDGGHAVFAVFGERAHKLFGTIAFIAMASFSVLGMYFYGSPSGFLFALILLIMLRVGHPRPLDETPLNNGRLIIAFITLLIFVLSFTPIPVKLN